MEILFVAKTLENLVSVCMTMRNGVCMTRKELLSESIQHLLLGCPFSKQVWFEILSWLRLTCRVPDGEENLTEWWSKARQCTAKPMHKGLASATLLIPWMTWKHRNDCVFNAATPSTGVLVSKIKGEAALWVRAGALGLRAILPNNWDVH